MEVVMPEEFTVVEMQAAKVARPQGPWWWLVGVIAAVKRLLCWVQSWLSDLMSRGWLMSFKGVSMALLEMMQEGLEAVLGVLEGVLGVAEEAAVGVEEAVCNGRRGSQLLLT